MQREILLPFVIGAMLISVPVLWIGLGEWLFPEHGLGYFLYMITPPSVFMCWMVGVLIMCMFDIGGI